MNQPILVTSRLHLRAFEYDDAQSVVALAGNPNVSKTTLHIPYPYTPSMARRWIATQADRWANKTGLVYAVLDKSDCKLIGTVSLVDISAKQAKLGFWIGEPYWGFGYCTEAAGALIDFTYSNLAVSVVCAEHLLSNPASGKVLQKLGMQFAGYGVTEDRYGVLVEIASYEMRPI